jgi:molybdopterin converting factor small subunit
MARLRLFGSARELAGAGAADVPVGTVAEVLGWAEARYGAEFGTLLATCAIWVNGEPAAPAQVVGPGDEVAVLPPVSGG